MKDWNIDLLCWCVLALPDYVVRDLLAESMIDEASVPTEVIEDILNTSMNGKLILFDI